MTAKSILIVDDDQLRCELLAELLEDEGYVVRIAADGEAGLVAAAETLTDLILLDIIMPRIDGVRFLQMLPHRIANAPPVIVISGSLDSVGGKTLEELGVRRKVRKPIDPADLLEQIEATFAEAAETQA